MCRTRTSLPFAVELKDHELLMADLERLEEVPLDLLAIFHEDGRARRAERYDHHIQLKKRERQEERYGPENGALPRRVQRALDGALRTGRRYFHYNKKGAKQQRPFDPEVADGIYRVLDRTRMISDASGPDSID